MINAVVLQYSYKIISLLVWFVLAFESNNALYRRTTISYFSIYFAFLLNLHFAGHLIRAAAQKVYSPQRRRKV